MSRVVRGEFDRRTAGASSEMTEVTMQLQLSPGEIELLQELLERASAELRDEAHKTEAHDWKRALKDRQQALESLRGKIKGAA